MGGGVKAPTFLEVEMDRVIKERSLVGLQDKLTEAFINYQWRLENPMPSTDETQDMKKEKYFMDAVFNARVNSLTAGVIDIVHNWIKEGCH